MSNGGMFVRCRALLFVLFCFFLGVVVVGWGGGEGGCVVF